MSSQLRTRLPLRRHLLLLSQRPSQRILDEPPKDSIRQRMECIQLVDCDCSRLEAERKESEGRAEEGSEGLGLMRLCSLTSFGCRHFQGRLQWWEVLANL